MKTCSYPECSAYTEGQTQFCASHNAYIRKEAKRIEKETLKKVKWASNFAQDKSKPKSGGTHRGVAKVSSKRKETLKSYTPLRKQFLEENPVCQAKILSVCEGPSESIHHCSTSELDFLEVSTWKAVCLPCHRYIETMMSAEERRKKGLLVDPVNKKFEDPHKI